MIVSNEDYSLSDEFIERCRQDHKLAETELHKELIELLKIAGSIRLVGTNAALLKSKISDARKMLALHRESFADGFLINNVGLELFKYAPEIYEKDADLFFESYKEKHSDAISKNKEIINVVEAISEVYKTMTNDELSVVFKVLTHIVDIVAATTM